MIGGGEALGLGAALGAAACYDTGYALQALEARRAPSGLALRPGLMVHLSRRPLWVGATALSVCGWPLQVLALAHAPLTLVQPVLALGLLLLLALGVRVLGEPVGRRELAGVVLIIGAVGCVAWAAPAEGGTVDRDVGLVAALLVLGAIAAAPFGLGALGRRPVWVLIAGAGAADGLAAFVAKLIAEDVSSASWLPALALAVLVAGVVALGVLSESTALQRAAATRVAPAVLSLQILIPVALAPLIGGEGWGDTPLAGAVLVAAMACVAGGVVLIGSSPAVVAIIARGDPGRPERDSRLAAASSPETPAPG